MELEGYQLQSIKSKRKQTQLILSGPGNDPARTIECNDIWGFRLDGALFRIEPEFGQPALVVLESSPCYYENGAAHLKMYLNGTTEATVVHGSGGYLSHGLNDPMTGVSLTKEKHTYKAPREFLEERPEYAPILRCANGQFHAYMLRACIKAFAEGQLA